MIENLSELRTSHSEDYNIYKEAMPHVARPYDDLAAEVYQDRVLPGKIKRMMALVGALVSGCVPCILFQTEQALEQGAEVEEIMEACGVAIALGGSMASGETTVVVRFLRELGRLD